MTIYEYLKKELNIETLYKFKRDYILEPLKKNKKGFIQVVEDIDKDDYYHLYIELNIRNVDICKMLKISNTIIDKWNKKFNIKKSQDKIFENCYQTNIKRYGNRQILKSTTIRQKIENKCLQQYGCKSSIGNNNIREKIKQTMLVNYGTTIPLKNDDIKHKMIETNIKRYGCKNVFQNEKIKEKSKQTMIKRYGVDHYSKTAESKNKHKVLPKISKEELLKLIYDDKIPLTQIGKMFGYKSSIPIYSWLNEYGINDYKSKRYLENKGLTKEKLIELYITKNLSALSIAKHFNTTKKVIQDHLKRYDIVKSNESVQLSRFISSHNPLQVKLLLNKDEFEKFIIENNIKNRFQLSKIIGIAPSTLNGYLQRFDLLKYFKKDTAENRWLDKLNIPNDNKHRQVHIGKYIVDGFDPDTNTVYEFLGDYWHGNPCKYRKNDYNTVIGKTFGELYESTQNKINELKSMGYNIIYQWENSPNNPSI